MAIGLSSTHRTKKRLAMSVGGVLSGLGIGVVSWFAWSWYDTRYPSWTEEVELSDGRVITLEQKRQYFENYGTNQSWVTFSLPEMGREQVWHSYLRPQRIDVHGGKVYVFGKPRGDRQYVYYRFPKYYMVAFVWSGSGFERIRFSDVPPSIRSHENLFPCIPDPRPRLPSIEKKNLEWCQATGDKGQFGKEINLAEYVQLAARYSRRSGGAPMSE